MRIHHMRMAGIGPFAAEQSVDFDTLGRAGMFLLEGPTGVGKSTIIDAIVFALYGDVASDSADKDRLVSDFREPNDEPMVEMVFSTAHGVFRVRRSPAYQRLKTRAKHAGDVTQQNARATLQRLAEPSDAGGTTIASRPAEVGPVIKEVVGLDRKQFVSTIVLPQGQFAEFLTASSNDRRPLLQKIFRTHEYEQLQQRLRDAGRAAEAERDEARASVVAALDKLRGAIPGPAATPLIEADATSEALPDLVDATVTQLRSRQAEARRARCEAEETHGEAASALAALQARIDRRDAKAAAERRWGLILAAREAVAGQRERVAADDRAARLKDALAAADRADEERSQAQALLERARAEAPAGLAQLGETAWPSRSASLRQTLGELTPLVELEAGLAEQEQQLALSQSAVADLRKQQSELQTRAEALPELVQAEQQALQSSTASAARGPAVTQELAAAERRAAAASNVERTLPLADAAARQVVDLLHQEQQATTALRELNAAYRAGIAATIGADLRPGEPCPACGSLEHPRPALPGADHITVEQVDAAEAEVQQARRRLEEARLTRIDREQELARLTAQAEGWTTDHAQGEIDRLQQEIDEVLRAARAATSAEHRLSALQAEQQQMSDQLRTVGEALTQAGAATAAISREMGLAKARVSQHLDGCASVAARAADLRLELAACDALASAADANARAAAAAHQASADLASAVAREGFASAEQARAARLEPADRQTLEAAVRAHDEESVKVRDILAKPELQDVDPAEAIDLVPAETALALAADALGAAASEAATADHILGQAEARAKDLAAALDERERVAAATSTSLQLAKLAEGRNVMGIDLATFVLVQRFRSVVAAANTHLSRMSNGRLILEAFEDVVKRSARAGLGIRVRDLHTESVRTPKTLSGGEMLYASLSLALGLAEIVTAESGGVELDTLFVDEGFGSLDQDTLDTVMGVLDGLRSNGRVLGLVSHVTEMKERIPERIEVRRLSATGASGLRIVA